MAALDGNPSAPRNPGSLAWVFCASGFFFRDLLPRYPLTFFLSGEGEVGAESTPPPKIPQEKILFPGCFFKFAVACQAPCGSGRLGLDFRLPSQCFSPPEGLGDPSEQTSFAKVICRPLFFPDGGRTTEWSFFPPHCLPCPRAWSSEGTLGTTREQGHCQIM